MGGRNPNSVIRLRSLLQHVPATVWLAACDTDSSTDADVTGFWDDVPTAAKRSWPHHALLWVPCRPCETPLFAAGGARAAEAVPVEITRTRQCPFGSLEKRLTFVISNNVLSTPEPQDRRHSWGRLPYPSPSRFQKNWVSCGVPSASSA
jgi:hypothetical protein